MSVTNEYIYTVHDFLNDDSKEDLLKCNKQSCYSSLKNVSNLYVFSAFFEVINQNFVLYNILYSFICSNYRFVYVCPSDFLSLAFTTVIILVLESFLVESLS